MGTDTKGRTCLTPNDKAMIQEHLAQANQRYIEIRSYLQLHGRIENPTIDGAISGISTSIRLIQDLPTCDQEDMLINTAKYAARELKKATGEEVYI